MSGDDQGEWIDVSEAQDGGVRKRVLSAGHGEKPVTKSKVRVHYVGTLKSGASCEISLFFFFFFFFFFTRVAKTYTYALCLIGSHGKTDGSEFDSSRARNQPFEFQLGVGQVIKAWDQGVASMQVGEKAQLECAPVSGFVWLTNWLLYEYLYDKQSLRQSKELQWFFFFTCEFPHVISEKQSDRNMRMEKAVRHRKFRPTPL